MMKLTIKQIYSVFLVASIIGGITNANAQGCSSGACNPPAGKYTIDTDNQNTPTKERK